MRFVFVWVLVGVITAGMVPVVAAQDGTVVLEPFTDETYGLQGVVPAGWGSVGPGLYARQQDAEDITLVAIQAVPADSATVWTSLLPQFGLSEAPESVGTYAGGTYTFTLYQFDQFMVGINGRFDLAMVEHNGQTIIVLLQTTADEYDTLHTDVFLPILDELAPLVDDTELPYHVEEVSFSHDDITLAGTLTVPATAGPHPAVVLMTGSGAQNRDEMVIPGFPIFRQIADYLTQQGIAVLRYDDRGVGQSTGEWSETSLSEFATDGQAAVDYLRTREDINPDQVGLLGHSEGGMYAAMIGANSESNVAFIILMAGPTTGGTDVLIEQNIDILTLAGADEAAIQLQLDFLESIFPYLADRDYEGLREFLVELGTAEWEALTEEERAQLGTDDFETYLETAVNNAMAQFANEPFASLMDYDPTADIGQIDVPVLAIFGGLDIQVNAETHTAALEAIVAENNLQDVTIITLDDANHLFQAAETGSVEEYSLLATEFTPEFLPTISEWLLPRIDIKTE